MEFSTSLEAALYYHSLGYIVLPAHRGSKKLDFSCLQMPELSPCLCDYRDLSTLYFFLTHPPNKQQLHEWFTNSERNIALCSSLDQVILDIDDLSFFNIGTPDNHNGCNTALCKKPEKDTTSFYAPKPQCETVRCTGALKKSVSSKGSAAMFLSRHRAIPKKTISASMNG